MRMPSLKPVIWVGQARRELRSLPDGVRYRMGYALYLVQTGDRPRNAKPLKGFGGAGVVELIEDEEGSTYRAVYTVRFAEAVYVLHAFQKKATSGTATPKHTMELIRERLREAEARHAERSRQGGSSEE